MSAKINLAPEVYQNSQRNKQRKKIATTIGIITSVSAGALVLVAFLIFGGQAAYLATVNGKIKEAQQELDGNSSLQDAVTAQQHLESVVGLFEKRTYISRFFQNIEQILPVGVALESVQIDPTNTVTIFATASTFNLANKFTKALQVNNVEIGSSAALGNTPYFTDIQLVSADAGPTGKVSFKITATMSEKVTASPKSSAEDEDTENIEGDQDGE